MNKKAIIFLHVALWAIMFLGPLSFMRGRDVTFSQYLVFCMSPLLMMVVFYLNYFWLTPRYFVTGKRSYYWIVNTIIVITLGVILHNWMSFFAPPHPRYQRMLETFDIIFFILRDIFNLVVVVAVSTTVALAMRWHHSEEARLKAEAAQADAELKNLRSQINPHFLLNTLNNIYALTAIDQTRAQNAIQQLSKMLRHMLYDNQEAEVVLKDELQFMENYVSLMKIRLSNDVDVTLIEDIQKPQIKIAPLLFISLVENAFKHGISPTEPCFVHINVTQKDNILAVVIENSNFPKTQGDRSGHGIGLQQVQRRLDLAYPGRYVWTKGVSDDGKIYSSKIRIEL